MAPIVARIRAEPDRAVFLLGVLLLAPLFWAPLGATHFLPGLDLPFHLSFADWLRKLGEPGSPYQGLYRAGPFVAPYLLHYALLMAMGTVLPIMVSHKILVALYIVAMPIAVGYLLAACGRSRIPALLGFPLAYNMPLHYGFTTFAFSLPVMAFLLGATAAALHDHERPLRRIVVVAMFALLLFFSHLQTFVFGLAAALAFIVFGGVPKARKLAVSAGLLPAVGAMAFWLMTSHYAGDAGHKKTSVAFALRALWDARFAEAHGRVWDDFTSHVTNLPRHVLRGFVDGADVTAAWMLVALIGVYVVGALFICLRRRGHRACPASMDGDGRRMSLPIFFVLLGGLVAYFGLPHHLPALEIMTLQPRFAVLVVMLGLLVIPLRAVAGVATAALLAVPLLGFSAWYSRVLVAHYRDYAVEVSDFERVLSQAPAGKKAMWLIFDRRSRVMNVESTLVALPAFYPVEKPAPGSMVPLRYCGMRHLPCRVIAVPGEHSGEPIFGPSRLPAPDPWLPQAFDPTAALGYFDLVFVRKGPPPEQLFGKERPRVSLVAQSGTWSLWQRQ